MAEANQWRAAVYVRNEHGNEIAPVEAYGPTPAVVRDNIAIYLRRSPGCAVAQGTPEGSFLTLPDLAAIEHFIQHDLIVMPAPA